MIDILSFMSLGGQLLPIFKKLNEKQGNSGLIVKERAPDQPNESDQDDQKRQCGQDLLDAIASGDALAVGQAIYDAANNADAEPHEEGEHIEPHSYEAQNIKAGQE